MNRFSLGVQSFSERVLEAIGRPHTVKQTEAAIELLKNETKNWNIDLIFAAADSTLEEWEEDLKKALAHGPNHISTYCLTFESDTAMFLKMLRGSKKCPSAEEEARFYLRTWEVLRGAGYEHYEVANWARPGYECRHNWNTWQMNDWVGYGPSAASQVNLQRWTNIADLGAWAEGIKAGKRKVSDEETLTPQQMAVDALVFGLRLPAGVDRGKLQQRWALRPSAAMEKLAESLCQEGLLTVTGECWRLTDQGLLVADAIGLELELAVARK